MSLEIDKIAPQVVDLAKVIGREREAQGKALKLAWETFARLGPEQESLKRKLESARSTWLVAEPVESLDLFPDPAKAPLEYLTMAVDGSHLSSERYSPKNYFLINLGAAILSYGSESDARLFSLPRLYFKPEDIAIKDPSGKERDASVEGALLGIKRQVEEASYLVSLMRETETGNKPLLGLLDGSLILWGLEAQKFPAFVHHAFLEEGLLKALDTVKKWAHRPESCATSIKDRPESPPTCMAAIASYISSPGSTEVANLLRLYLCPHEPVNCDKFCGGKAPGERECDVVSGVMDRTLFTTLLKVGQRSPLFGCRSSVMSYYGGNRVCFFYLKLEEEIARIEVPLWIGENSSLLALTHSLVYDQCQRGLGYPVVLSEAHERAVLRAEDRELFNSLLEKACQEEDLRITVSAKASSKKTRWI